MPLGKEIGLDPGDIMLDRDPAPPRKGALQSPTFRLTALVRLPVSAIAELLLRYARRQIDAGTFIGILLTPTGSEVIKFVASIQITR